MLLKLIDKEIKVRTYFFTRNSNVDCIVFDCSITVIVHHIFNHVMICVQSELQSDTVRAQRGQGASQSTWLAAAANQGGTLLTDLRCWIIIFFSSRLHRLVVKQGR